MKIMDVIRPNQSYAPEIAVRQVSAEASGSAELWKVAWLVKNRAPQPLRILELQLPHGQFKAEPSVFEPPVDLNPGGEKEFHTVVRCSEPAGLVTENAFLIFHVIWNAQPWRIFVRARVVAASDGMPRAEPESITTQSVGFSQREP
jgi:hypothetical protein